MFFGVLTDIISIKRKDFFWQVFSLRPKRKVNELLLVNLQKNEIANLRKCSYNWKRLLSYWQYIYILFPLEWVADKDTNRQKRMFHQWLNQGCGYISFSVFFQIKTRIHGSQTWIQPFFKHLKCILRFI